MWWAIRNGLIGGSQMLLMRRNWKDFDWNTIQGIQLWCLTGSGKSSCGVFFFFFFENRINISKHNQCCEEIIFFLLSFCYSFFFSVALWIFERMSSFFIASLLWIKFKPSVTLPYNISCWYKPYNGLTFTVKIEIILFTSFCHIWRALQGRGPKMKSVVIFCFCRLLNCYIL